MLPLSLLLWMLGLNLASAWLVLHTRAQKFEFGANDADSLSLVQRKLFVLRRVAWIIVALIGATLAIFLILEFRRLANLHRIHNVPHDLSEPSGEYYVARDLSILALVVFPIPLAVTVYVARILNETTRRLRALHLAE